MSVRSSYSSRRQCLSTSARGGAAPAAPAAASARPAAAPCALHTSSTAGSTYLRSQEHARRVSTRVWARSVASRAAVARVGLFGGFCGAAPRKRDALAYAARVQVQVQQHHGVGPGGGAQRVLRGASALGARQLCSARGAVARAACTRAAHQVGQVSDGHLARRGSRAARERA